MASPTRIASHLNDLFIRLSVALLIVNIPIECLEERVEKIGDSWASELQE